MTEFDFWAGFSIAMVGITAFFLWYQIRKQTKATSATLALEMLKRMRDEDFRDVVEKILEDKPENCNATDLDRVLNHFEYMAVFEKDGTLDIEHIKELYTPILLKIKTNTHIKNRMMSYVEGKPEYYFSNLRNLLEKIN